METKEKTQALAVGNESYLAVISNLDSQVMSVVGSAEVAGFKKAYIVATAAAEIRKLLTSEYMEPIMNLQGNKLGFRTDKDKAGGYPVETVKDCLIEAVLMGVQPVGNEFNIIAGNTYITKEGFGHLLSKFPGLWYEIVPSLPKVENTAATIVMNIYWSLNQSEKRHRAIEIPIKVNNMMGSDAIIGKATRKARAWLYNTITGCEISDGDVADLDSRAHIAATAPDLELMGVEIQTMLDERDFQLTDKERARVRQVLENKESQSYQKVIDLLKTREITKTATA